MSKSLSAHQRTNNPGLTLVEVLVIISILGMLSAIAIPAVNHARETGRRNICTNNFRQFGTALVAYETTYGKWPAALAIEGIDKANKSAYSTLPYSPHVYLLPHLDLNDVYKTLNVKTTPFGTLSQLTHLPNLGHDPIAVFRCPSDTQELPGWPGNNIRVCLGSNSGWIDHSMTGVSPNGAFAALAHRRSGDVHDGVSRTVAASEKLLGSGIGGVFDRRRDSWYSGAASVPGFDYSVENMIATCGSLSTNPSVYFEESGATWLCRGYECTWYNHAVGPNVDFSDCTAMTMTITPTGRSDPDMAYHGVFRATSYHPGGVNVVFLDAHTEFVINDVELPIWRALGTISGAD